MISPGLFFPLFWLSSLTGPKMPPLPVPNPAEITSAHELVSQLAQKHLNIPTLETVELAMEGWEKLEDNLEKPLLTVIDFTLPSTQKRLWIIDVEKREIILNSVVAHGRNSGELMAERFSNTAESYQSSVGFYKTAETYQGKHGYSLRLDGLEKGFNDQARARAIVIHGADYAREEFAKATGRLGRSLGCPALPTELSAKVIDIIKNGSLIFIYGKDPSYLSNSEILQPKSVF